MVAITVILAAVIASYVFGTVQKTKLVAATALMTTGGDIDITYQGGQDADSITGLNITAPNGFFWYIIDSTGTLAESGSAPVAPRIGAVMKLNPAADWPSG